METRFAVDTIENPHPDLLDDALRTRARTVNRPWTEKPRPMAWSWRRRHGPRHRLRRTRHRSVDGPMLYFANPAGGRVKAAMDAGVLACMASPNQGNRIDPEWTWTADNGCFSDSWQPAKWVAFLQRWRHLQHNCISHDRPRPSRRPGRNPPTVGPMVVDRHRFGLPARLRRPRRRRPREIPWDQLEQHNGVLFIGGGTEWKKSGEAMYLAGTAQHAACGSTGDTSTAANGSPCPPKTATARRHLPHVRSRPEPAPPRRLAEHPPLPERTP